MSKEIRVRVAIAIAVLVGTLIGWLLLGPVLFKDINLDYNYDEYSAIIKIQEERNAFLAKADTIIGHHEELSFEDRKLIAETVWEMTVKHENLNADFILAMIVQESGFNPKAVSSAGAVGLMQIMPSTGKFLAVQEGIEPDLYDIETNIRLGCRYFSSLLREFDQTTALYAYNYGPGRAKRKNLPQETLDYAPSILKIFESLHKL